MAGLFIKLDCDYWDHPKVVQAGVMAGVLYLRMTAYAMQHTTDGYVPAAQLPRFALPGTGKLTAALADVGLIEPADGGWLIPGYVERYLSAAELERRRHVNAENGRKGGRPRTQQKPRSVSDGLGNGTETEPRENQEVEVDVDVDNPPPPEVTPVPAPADLAVVAAADSLIAALGYVDPPPANQGERNYVARAVARGWTPGQLHDLAIEAGARDDVRDHRAYLLGVLKRCANEDPPARAGPAPAERRGALHDERQPCANPDCVGGMVGGFGPDGRPEPVRPCPDCHVLGATA